MLEKALDIVGFFCIALFVLGVATCAGGGAVTAIAGGAWQVPYGIGMMLMFSALPFAGIAALLANILCRQSLRDIEARQPVQLALF